MNQVNRKYEGLFILDGTSREDAVKEALDKVQAAIKAAGGAIQNVQKMETRPFARPSAKHQSGYYVNITFSAPPKAIAELDAKFHLETGLLRWQFTQFVEEPDRPTRKRKLSEDKEPVGTRLRE